jgi:hypothetical protein
MLGDVTEVDDADAGQRPDLRLDVVGEREVDDGEVAVAAREDLPETLTVDDRVRRAAARDDEVSVLERLGSADCATTVPSWVCAKRAARPLSE